ncbi:MAG: leucyl/phenylalanyl-tRNA--protein transferase [Allgaiera sp.]|jgi:leucyl/phenylalanyl-tRNA--protein transferase|nr:leucyl/phenylalanyl-tRNA--protein transferase [Allgaiera sp.]
MRGLTPEMLLNAYAIGIFPMAQSRDSDDLQWIDPRQRGVFPLQNFHISRSLKRKILIRPFQITTNTDFSGVMAGCADRPETWINPEIETLTRALHRAGHAHSLEVWDGTELVGGVYGVTLGAAFFGESMFSRRTDASKIALAYLVHRLRAGGFTLFDTQFLTDHLASLGAVEIPRASYRKQLAEALQSPADFNALVGEPAPQDVVQRSSQTS